MEKPRRSQFGSSDESESRIAFATTNGASPMVEIGSGASGFVSQFRSQTAVDVDVQGDHRFGRESLRVTQTFFAPRRALRRITQAQQIGCEAVFIIDTVKKSGVASRFGEWTGVCADDRTTAGLRFNNRPAETLEARRIHERRRAVIERLERFAFRVFQLRNALRDSELSRERHQLRV